MRYLVILLLLLPAPFVAAQENILHRVYDPKTNTFVQVTSLFGKLPPSGCLPVRVTIANRTAIPRTVSLSFRSTDGFFGNNGSEVRSSFSASAAPGRTEITDFTVPLVTSLNKGYGNNLTLHVDLSGSLGSESNIFSSAIDPDQPAVLLSEPLYTPNASSLDAEATTRFGAKWSSLTFAGRFTAREMPEDWRAYSGIDAILLTDSDWSALAPGTRNAILAWNRLGGQLLVHATAAATDLATLGIAPLPAGTRKADRSFGSVRVLPASAGLKLDAKDTLNLVTSAAPLPPRVKSLREDTPSAWPLQAAFGTKAWNYLLFILVLIAFGVIVGPVNLFVFAKSGQRHRLFITTPLISLAASALLVGLILVQDGTGGRGFRAVLMEVRPDNDENAAYLLQEQISRTGVLLGSSFQLSEPAALSPLPLSSASPWARVTDANDGGGCRYTLDPADGKLRAAGDWFQSRSEQGHLLTAVVPTRGRVERTGPENPPRLMSSFDFPLDQLVYQDHSGKAWTADNLEPGKPVTCRELPPAELARFLSDQSAALTVRHQKLLKRVTDRNDHFIAAAKRGPAIETFRSISWKQSTALVTGPVLPP
jgi:hypothetical protein